MSKFEISGFKNVTKNSESAMKTSINQQIIAIGVYVDSAFQNYDSGIFDNGPSYAAYNNHGVSFVGYGKGFVNCRSFCLKESMGNWLGH